MKSLSDSVNWYGRNYPLLTMEEEVAVAAGEDAANELVRHSVFYVVKGLVLRRKSITANNLTMVIGSMIDSANAWIASDRSTTCHDFILEDIANRFMKITRYSNLLDSDLFVSFDAPAPGGMEGRHGSEPKTWGDFISSTVGGRAGSSLSPDMVCGKSTSDLVYDVDLDAYVRADHVKDRKKHVIVTRSEVDTGIFSYASEVRLKDEKLLERLSPIRNRNIADRIVAISKAKRKKLRKSFRGQFYLPPVIGKSAASMPSDWYMRRWRGSDGDVTFKFDINKRRTNKMQEKCLGCALFEACSSWLSRRYFILGYRSPLCCSGPFTTEELIK